MSRYIDADRLKTDFAGTLVALERKPKFDGLQIILIRCVFDMIGKIVDNAPTVDAVQVVRCEQCKYAMPLVYGETEHIVSPNGEVMCGKSGAIGRFVHD